MPISSAQQEPMGTPSARSSSPGWSGGEHPRQHYTVPTHLKTPDKLLFGLTARQLLILLTGGSLAYALYLQWSDSALSWGLSPLWVQVLGLLVIAPLVLLTLSTAFLQIAGRPLEQWAIVFLHLRLAPRTYIWHSCKWERYEAGERDEREDDFADMDMDSVDGEEGEAAFPDVDELAHLFADLQAREHHQRARPSTPHRSRGTNAEPSPASTTYHENARFQQREEEGER